MNTTSFPLKVVGCLAAGLLVFTLQACRTLNGGATAEAPYVVSFEFQQPVQISDAQKERWADALNNYSVPTATKLLVDGRQIWPPKMGNLKTESVLTSGTNGPEGGAVIDTRGSGANTQANAIETRGSGANTRNLAAVIETRGTGANLRNQALSRMTTETRVQGLESLGRAKSTQFIAFETEADMRAFLRVMAGK